MEGLDALIRRADQSDRAAIDKLFASSITRVSERTVQRDWRKARPVPPPGAADTDEGEVAGAEQLDALRREIEALRHAVEGLSSSGHAP